MGASDTTGEVYILKTDGLRRAPYVYFDAQLVKLGLGNKVWLCWKRLSLLPVELRPLVEVETRTEALLVFMTRVSWFGYYIPTGHVASVMDSQVS